MPVSSQSPGSTRSSLPVRTPRPRQRPNPPRWVWLVVLGVVLLLVWPLQIILAAIFLGAGAVVVTAATAGFERRLDAQTSTARRLLLRRRIRDVAFALAALGLVLIVLWPATMAITTLLVALLAFGALAYLRWRHPEWWSL